MELRDMLDQIHVATCMLWPWWVKRFFLFIQNKMFILTFSFQLSKNNICIYYVIDWISLHAESNLRRVSFDILFSFVVYHLLNMNIIYSYHLQSDGQCLHLDLGTKTLLWKSLLMGKSQTEFSIGIANVYCPIRQRRHRQKGSIANVY